MLYLQGRPGALLTASPEPVECCPQRRQHSSLHSILAGLQTRQRWQSLPCSCRLLEHYMISLQHTHEGLYCMLLLDITEPEQSSIQTAALDTSVVQVYICSVPLSISPCWYVCCYFAHKTGMETLRVLKLAIKIYGDDDEGLQTM